MYYDLLVLGILGYSVVRGARKGFIWQLASIAALVLCFVFAERVSVVLAPYIEVGAPLDRWIAMLLLYIVFSFIAFAMARVLRGWIERARFVEYDRHLGALFGFLTGVTICLVLTFFVVTLSEKARGHVLGSYSGSVAALAMDRLHPVMPEELHEILEPYIHRLDRPDLDLKHTHPRDDSSDGPDQTF